VANGSGGTVSKF